MLKENISKLPKWAQIKIRCLESNVSYYKKQVEEIKGEKETNIYIRDGIQELRPLSKNSTIEYVLDKQKGHSGKIHISLSSDTLEIYGGSSIIVKPEASNHIKLQLGRF